MSDVQNAVLAAIKIVTEQDVSVDMQLNDLMDSLERASLAVELTDYFPDANLIENEDFFKAVTVQNLIDVLEGKNGC